MSSVLPDDPVFPYGVATGDPTGDSVVLWTKTAPGSAVRWFCREVDGATRSEVAAADELGTLRTRLTGLRPGARHEYWFTAHDGTASPHGRFRTLPVDRDRVRFGVASCAKYNAGHFNAYARLAERDDLDFVLHLGDYIYEAADRPPASQTPGADIGRTFDPVHECRTHEDYRRRYAQYRLDPDVRALHAAHAVISTIDDHELADNAWSGGAQEHRDAEHGPWATRLAGALAAWAEWTPTLLRPAQGDSLWREVDLGEVGRLLLAETRTQRTRPDEPDPALRSSLGPAQLAWLRDRLAAARGWAVLAMPSMLASLAPAAADEDARWALEMLKLVEAGTRRPFHDRWDNYPVERERLLDLLGAGTASPLVLSGDVHFAAHSRLVASSGPLGEEWTTTSVTSPNIADKMGWPPRTRSRCYEERLVAGAPQLQWCDLDSHGYLVVTLTPEVAECEWWVVDTVLERSTRSWCVHTATAPARTQAQR